MRIWPSTLIALVFSTSSALAGDFDGSRPLVCHPAEVNDCLPGIACKHELPGPDTFSSDLTVDFAKKEARGRYRKNPLPIANMQTTESQLIVQGTDLQFAWSAVINQKDGGVTVTIADRQGAYVLFGQCKPQ